MAYLSQASILYRPIDQIARWRLILSVTVLGVLLAIALEHVYLIARTVWYEEAHHLQFWSGIWYSAAAAAGALIVVPGGIYVLRERPEYPGGFWIWMPAGVAFGVLVPIFTGFFTPLATLMIEFFTNDVPASGLPPWIIDRLIRGVFSMFVDGAPAIRHGLAAGAIFAATGYACDQLNATENRIASRWGAPALALVIGGVLLLIALQASPEWLRDLL